MAYDYNKYKSVYEGLNDDQRKKWDTKYWNTADYKQFQSDYAKEQSNVYTPATTNKTTSNSIYGDSWGAANATKYTWTWVAWTGDYQYSSKLNTQALPSNSLLFGNTAIDYWKTNPWYLERRNNYIANALYNEWKTDENSIRNYLSTFQDYRDYDKVWQDNTVQAILNRMGTMEKLAWGSNNGSYNAWTDLNSKLESEIWNNYNNANKGYSDLMWGGDNYYTDFRDAVNGKLEKAYGIQSLDDFKSRYPEQYESLMQSLEAVEWVRNATDPNERQMLDGALQGIIGSGVWAWSDWSKLSVLEESVMNKFKNPDQIKSDAQNVIKLQTEWNNISEIADKMNMSEDQVQQLILLANWLDSKAWEYYQLKDDVAKDITEPYDTKMQRLEEKKKIAVDRANRNLERLKEDFDTNMDRQKQQNDINLHNADFLAGQYGYWMSRRWIEWLNYVADQAQWIIDDLTKNYDRNSIEMADGIADIIRNWQRNNEDLMKASQDALTAAKNSFTSNMLAIQQQYGTVWLQAQQALSNNVQAFIEQAETIYDNALARQQQNLSNLITNVSNLNALAAQNLTLRNAKIQQFQSESMNLNRNQLQSLAQQLGMDTASYQDLVNYQVQAVQNELNGYMPWAWVQFQSEIQSLLDQWYTPTQAMQSIMNSTDFKAMQQAATWGGDNWSMSGGIMYNKATGEYYDLNWDEYWTIWDKLYNKRTGEIIDINWNVIWDSSTNYVTSETVNGKTYGVSENTINWLYNFMNEHEIGSTGGQCGKFVNDYLESIGVWRIFTDPIDKKKAAINTEEWYKPQVWDIAVMDSPSARKYGHVAIVTAVNDDGTITTLESNKSWEGEVFTRTFKPSDRWFTRVFGYYHPDGEATNVTANGTAWGTGTWGNMSDYDINTATMRIGRMAYGANISNSESERVEKVLRDWAAMWKTQTDILYDVLWMTITNNKDKAEPLINIMLENADENWLKWYDTVWFANLINSWKIDLAVNKVEKAVAGKQWIWKDFVDNEASSIAMYDKWNRAIELINDNLNKLWIVAGNWNKQKSKFLKNENFQQLESALTALVADWRHEMAGSAVTETELKMIDSLIPSVKDNPYNAIQKIQELQNDVLARYNSQRWTLDLPYVDQTTLKDKKQRANLYYQNPWINNTTPINNISPISVLANQVQGRWRISAWGTMTTWNRF